MRRGIIILAGGLGTLALFLTALAMRGEAQGKARSRPAAAVDQPAPLASSGIDESRRALTESETWTLRTGGRFSAKKTWHSWPPKEVKIGESIEAPQAIENPKTTKLESKDEPAPPKPERVREVSQWTDVSKLAGLLRDPKEPSTLKSIAIAKLSKIPDAVPVLVEFVKGPASWLKPAAVRALYDLGATDELTALARETVDPQVRLAIAGGAR